MHDGIDVGMLCEDVIESSLVGDVDLIEGGPPSADEVHAIDGFLRRVVEIVDDHDTVAGDEQFERREGANVARSSGCCYVSDRSKHTHAPKVSAYPVTRIVCDMMRFLTQSFGSCCGGAGSSV